MSEPDAATGAMAAIAAGVALGAAAAPRPFLRAFGIPARGVTGAAVFGWRLFAVRTGYISAQALRGDTSARDAFLPVQVLDQAVFWHGLRSGAIPRRTALLAAATSGAIVALDLSARRTRRRPAASRTPR